MLGNNIARLRKTKNITQQELANSIGIGRTALSKIENGVFYPSAETMKAISDFLDEPLGNVFFNPDVLKNNTKINSNTSTA